MDKAYSHKDHEERIYGAWLESGLFTPPSGEEAEKSGLEPFTIIMPPPNANDPLHVGHAMFITVEDILIRHARMQGKATLWLPGTDHAGIETQFVFEKKLKKKGKSRFSYDRDTLYEMIWEYVQENSGVAIDQMKKLGASADWSRTKFTLDDDCVGLTLNTFERMHEEGVVKRKQALVNYCTKCGTAYSQLEINHVERTSPLYYMKYGPFELATVRPETKFGDTALAVHPEDKRYKEYIGKEIEVEGLAGSFSMKVVADEYVDPEFGTGVVKITPFHDHNDFEVWQRHLDEMPEPQQALGFDGKMTDLAGAYAGLPVAEARKRVAADLEKKGLMVRVDENYTNSVAVCYRCGRDIEPLPMAQFFVTVKPLTKRVLEVLDKKETVVYGAGHDKILRHWLKNLKDWNISRQIVWGIRLPIWYEVGNQQSVDSSQNDEIVVGFLNKSGKFVSGKIGELLEKYSFEEIEAGLQTLTAPEDASYVVSRENPSFAEASDGKPGANYLQETDTFDTWFSSSQWPVNTLKTTKKGDFEYYYPTSAMETGYDILPFWVMRMMMMGLYLTDKTPFERVYLHGLVRDEKGLKMSKSKGNVINPLELVEKYGADSLRMALVMSTTAGHDSAVGESKVKGMRNFSNKIWNAARFIQMNRTSSKLKAQSSKLNQKFEAKLKLVVEKVGGELDGMRVGQAAETVHNEFWHWFCDVCLEEVKTEKLSVERAEEGLKVFLKLLHPFMPFVTEAVWEEMGYGGVLMGEEWPGKN